MKERARDLIVLPCHRGVITCVWKLGAWTMLRSIYRRNFAVQISYTCIGCMPLVVLHKISTALHPLRLKKTLNRAPRTTSVHWNILGVVSYENARITTILRSGSFPISKNLYDDQWPLGTCQRGLVHTFAPTIDDGTASSTSPASISTPEQPARPW